MTDKTSSIDLLEKAKEILSTRGWCQASFARDKDGYSVHHAEETACEFCAQGSLMRAAWELGQPHRGGDDSSVPRLVYDWAEHHLIQGIEDGHSEGLPIDAWNDDYCQSVEEVVAAYDRALVSLRNEAYLKEDSCGS